jgi:predicted acetyltransferase
MHLHTRQRFSGANGGAEEDQVILRMKNLPSPMAKHAAKPSAHIEVLPAAPEQAPILANLLELYAHDFSEFHDIDLEADGRFGYRHLPLYWSEPDRHPFLVRMNGKLAGLVLVKRGSEVSGNETVWDMAEFFVIRRYRRRGVGTHIAHEVWRQFPGAWEIRVMQSNISAYHFWACAISTFTGEVTPPACVEKDGECWTLFSFESKRLA